MRRTLCTAMALAFVVSVAGCGSDGDAGGASPSVLSAESAASSDSTGPDVFSETSESGASGSSGSSSEADAPESTAVTGFVFGTGPCPDTGGSALPDQLEAPRKCIEDGRTYTAEVATNHGSFTIELAADLTPGTVNNFVSLARFGYYDGSSCHRIIADFAIQCGRRGEDETAPGYRIPDELPTIGEYADGVVAMANTGQPNSGGGQWFIIAGDAGASLPPQYSIVGTVSDDDAAVVAALEALADPTAPNGVPPLEPVDIESVTITES